MRAAIAGNNRRVAALARANGGCACRQGYSPLTCGLLQCGHRGASRPPSWRFEGNGVPRSGCIVAHGKIIICRHLAARDPRVYAIGRHFRVMKQSSTIVIWKDDA